MRLLGPPALLTAAWVVVWLWRPGPVADLPLDLIPPAVAVLALLLADAGLVWWGAAEELGRIATARDEARSLAEGAREAAAEPLLLIDLDSLEVLEGNPAAAREFRYRRWDLAGQPLALLLGGEEEAEALIEAAEASPDEVVEAGVKAERQDGSRFPAEVRLRSVRGGRGERRAVISVADRSAERSLADAEERAVERQRSLYANVSDVVLTVSKAGTVLTESPSLGPVLGFWSGELNGENVFGYLHPSDRSDFRAALDSVGESAGSSLTREYRVRDRSGGWRVMETHVRRPPADRDVQGLIVTWRDVTREREAEEELRKSHEKYQRIFRVSPLAIYISTLEDGRILEANEGFRDIFGHDPEEAVGRTSLELGIWKGKGDRDRIVRRVRSTGAASKVEVTLRSKSGREKDVLLFAERLVIDGESCLLVVGHDITQRKEAERKLEQLALFDTLTGLPNRNLFHDRLEHALDRSRRHETRVALVYVDLDRFKVVNDTLGHAAGDQLLAAASQRIEECFRSEDTVARLGGDEFGAVLEGTESAEAARAAAKRLMQAMEPPFEIHGTQAHVSASIGIALSSPEIDRPQDLLRYGDIAMYRAKEREGTTFHVFEPEKDSEATRRLHRENSLREAIDRRELRIHYQPIVSLRTGEIVSAEALVRWEHPERGLLSPEEFIPLAEETGLIVPLGEWVLNRTCRQVVRWKDEGTLAPDFALSVNVSPYQFREPNFLERAQRILRRSRLSPEDLQLEVTESMVIQGKAKIDELADLGLMVAIDDFGTGYSSLNYLKQLKLSSLKIDRSFVKGLGTDRDDDAIVQTILLLAQRLDLKVLAEGVETERQLTELLQLECDFGQGFYFSPPVEGPEFRKMVRRSHDHAGGPLLRAVEGGKSA